MSAVSEIDMDKSMSTTEAEDTSYVESNILTTEAKETPVGRKGMGKHVSITAKKKQISRAAKVRICIEKFI
jgi:hypothetical protein